MVNEDGETSKFLTLSRKFERSCTTTPPIENSNDSELVSTRSITTRLGLDQYGNVLFAVWKSVSRGVCTAEVIPENNNLYTYTHELDGDTVFTMPEPKPLVECLLAAHFDLRAISNLNSLSLSSKPIDLI